MGHLLSYRSLSMELAKKTGCVPAEDASRSGLDGFQQVFGCNRLRRKFDHELAAAIGNAFLVEGVESLLAFFANGDQICIAQNGKVMRYRGLRDIQLLDDLVDRERTATADVHDLLAGFVRDGFGEEDRVKFHIDNFLFDII